MTVVKSKFQRPYDSGIADVSYEQFRWGQTPNLDGFVIPNIVRKKKLDIAAAKNKRTARYRKIREENYNLFKLPPPPHEVRIVKNFLAREAPEDGVVPELKNGFDPKLFQPIAEIFAPETYAQDVIHSRVILTDTEERQFEANKKILEDFIKKNDCPRLSKAWRRIAKLKNRHIPRVGRAVAKKVRSFDPDPFHFKVLFPAVLFRKPGQSIASRRHELLEKMADMRYDFDYEKRPGYKERQEMRDRYLEMKKKRAEAKKKAKDAAADAEKKKQQQQVLQKLQVAKIPPLPVAVMKESPKQPSVIKMIDMFATPSIVAKKTVAAEKKKEVVKTKELNEQDASATVLDNVPLMNPVRPSVEEALEIIEIIEVDQEEKKKELERRRKEEEDLRRKQLLEDMEKRRKEEEELKRKKLQEEMEQKKLQEETKRKREEEEEMRKRRFQAEVDRKNAEMEEDRRLEAESVRKRIEDAQAQERARMQAAIEATRRDVMIAEQKKAEMEETMRRNELEAEQRNLCFRNRLKRELIDDEYERAANAPSCSTSSSTVQSINYAVDEYLEEAEENDNDIQIISEKILPIIDYSAMPEKLHLKLRGENDFHSIEIETFLPTENEKVEMYRSRELDYRLMRTQPRKYRPVTIVCSDKGPIDGISEAERAYKDFTSQLINTLGAKMTPMQFHARRARQIVELNNELLSWQVNSSGNTPTNTDSSSSPSQNSPQTVPSSPENDSDKITTRDYPKITLESLQEKWTWPFSETANIYWPVFIDNHDPSGETVGESAYRHMRQFLASHSCSGSYTATQHLIAAQSPEEACKEFEANYETSGEAESSVEEWEKYKSQPGRFSNRKRFKPQRLDQDREEASRRDREKFEEEVQQDLDYNTSIMKYREEKNFDAANNSSRDLLRHHIESNRVDFYSKVEEDEALRCYHPGRRVDSPITEHWTRSGYRNLYCVDREQALSDYLNELTEPYDDLVPSVYSEFELWALSPMLASLWRQANEVNFDVHCNPDEMMELKQRRKTYDKMIEKKDFIPEEIQQVTALSFTDRSCWTIIYDHLSSHFKFLPPLSKLMMNPVFQQIVDEEFEKMSVPRRS